MRSVDLAVYIVVGCALCAILIVDAGAPAWLAATLSAATVAIGARPVKIETAE